MSSLIYKYQLFQGENAITVPAGSEVVSVAEQYGSPVAYIMQNQGAEEMDIIVLHVVPTGQQFNFPVKKFHGTVMMLHGALVLHVLEQQ